MSLSTKVKVTLRLEGDLIAAVYVAKQESAEKSRSAVVEAILRQWHQAEQQRTLEQETEAYDFALSDKEWEQDQQWMQLTSSQICGLALIKKARGMLKGNSSLTQALLKARAEERKQEESHLLKPSPSNPGD